VSAARRIVGSASVAASLRRHFPKSLDGAPFLMPGVNAVLRRGLEQWFDTLGIRPRVVAEIDDGGLSKVLAAGGHGVYACPTVMEDDARQRYGLRGRCDTLAEESVLRDHRRTAAATPGAVAICGGARSEYFA
jgi:LysR family transcriptional activator of nhaA